MCMVNYGMDKAYWCVGDDPCVCWLAGNDVVAYDPSDADDMADRYQHPDQFRAGVMARYEQERDI